MSATVASVPPFNLIDEPWLPCTLADAAETRVELGIREALVRAAEIRELADASPLVTVSLHRLLLAILHRVYGPATREEWAALWQARAFDSALDAYLDGWRHRFNLFDVERPFYQTTEVGLEYAKTTATMVYGLTLGNYVTLFDHTLDAAPPALSPAEAARHLVAFQSFALGGLVSLQRGEPPDKFKSADAAPLAKGAVVLVKGDTLFETLLLNLYRYNGPEGAPFLFDPAKDRPAWERDVPARAGEDRAPGGYFDLLTWQSRRMRLVPAWDDGQAVVRQVVIMKGHQFPDGWHLRDHEPMLAFRAIPKPASGQEPWMVLSLQRGRALWRDSLALFQSADGHVTRPKMHDWVAQLRNYHDRRQLAVDVHGMSIDRASVFFWRHERLPLPLTLLEKPDVASRLGRALDLAEQVGRLFRDGFDEIEREGGKKVKVPRPLHVFAEALAAPLDGMSPNPDTVKGLVASIAAADAYWPKLEVPFRRFIVDLADDDGEYSLPRWTVTLRDQARATFNNTIGDFDPSARAMKAEALARRLFEWRLGEILGEYLKLAEAEEAA
jgi:CRISPR system Cascade subunit CasA